MISMNKKFSQYEQKILKKLFEYNKEYGNIAEISCWAEELGLSKQKIISIAKEMKGKKWLEHFELGLDFTVDVSLSVEGFKIIGESPIDYQNDIKQLLLEKKNNQYNLEVIFYNNNKIYFSFSAFDFTELSNLVNNNQNSITVSVSDWLKEHKPELRMILNAQQKRHTKKLFDFCELIRNYV